MSVGVIVVVRVSVIAAVIRVITIARVTLITRAITVIKFSYGY